MSARPEVTWRPVQRIVLPDDAVPPGTRDLYVRVDGESEIVGRTSLRLGAEAHASFATYFGGFPRVAWADTGFDRLRLSLRIDGEARIHVRGTDAAGMVRDLADSSASGDWSLELPLDERSAGWIWFDVDASGPVTLHDAEWSAPEPARPETSVSIAITTFNRSDDCVALIARLASDPQVKKRILQVVVTDQGTQQIRSNPGFAEAARPWGPLLRVIEQDNLGGSGGFSRGMLEARRTPASHVLVLDDDVNLEPESLLRMLARAEHSQHEPLIGAQMLRLTEPTRLHSWGERVDRRRFWWEPVHPELAGLDLAEAGPDRLPVLSEPCPVDFNGWWMCLIPLSVIESVGASLPLFIKWDDAEFGLRAAAAGHRTITLPGAALWHVPWTSKDDGLDWQAYYQLRNRIVTALIHGRRPRLVLSSTWAQDLNHVLCLQYGSARLRNTALQDVLSGPEHLLGTLRDGRSRAQRILAQAGQAVHADAGEPEGEAGAAADRAPRGVAATSRRLARVLLHQLAPVGRTSEFPAAVPRASGKWWRLGLMDEAELRSATGTGHFLLRRSRREAWHLLSRSAWLRARLWFGWRTLSGRYRSAAPELAGADSWQRIYAEGVPPVSQGA